MATFTTPSGATVDTGASNTGANVTSTPAGGTSTGTAASSDSSSFISQLQQKLLGQSDLISSENTGLEDKINTAIAGIQSGQDSSSQAITSQYNAKEADATTTGQQQMTSTQDAQRGFATNTAALKQLTDSTNKQVNDLEQQKQQLILSGQADASSKISAMQIQAIQFQQQAQQQVFSNLLGMGQFAQSQQQIALSQQQNNIAQQGQDLQSQSAISAIATKYGLTVSPGETLQSITTKAAPFASTEEKQQMALATAQINAANAQTAKAYSDVQANKPLDAVSLAALASQYNTNPQAVLSTVKTTDQLGQILQVAGQQIVQANQNVILNNKANNVSKADAINNVTSTQGLSPDQTKTLLDYVESSYGPDSAQKKPANTFVSPGSQFGGGPIVSYNKDTGHLEYNFSNIFKQ